MFSSWLLLVYVLFFSFLTCPDLWADSPPWLQTGVSPPCSLFLLLLHSYKFLDSYKWHGIYPGHISFMCEWYSLKTCRLPFQDELENNRADTPRSPQLQTCWGWKFQFFQKCWPDPGFCSNCHFWTPRTCRGWKFQFFQKCWPDQGFWSKLSFLITVHMSRMKVPFFYKHFGPIQDFAQKL